MSRFLQTDPRRNYGPMGEITSTNPTLDRLTNFNDRSDEIPKATTPKPPKKNKGNKKNTNKGGNKGNIVRPGKITAVSGGKRVEPKMDYDKGKGALKNVKAYTDMSNLLDTQFAQDESARDFETAYQTAAIQRQSARDNFINQMKMRDMTMEAQLEAYQSNQQQVRRQLQYNEAAAERAVRDTDQILADRVLGIGFDQERMNIDREARTYDLAVARKQATQQFAAQKAAADQQYEQQQDATAFQQRATEIQELVDQGKAGVLGRKGVSATRQQNTIAAIAGFNSAKLTNDLLNYSATRDITVRTARKQKQLTKAQTELQFDIVEKRQNLSKRELGEKLLSAQYSYEQSREDIFLDKYKADTTAYAKSMVMPSFADAPKEPFVIPSPEFVAPPLPIEVPKGQAPKQPAKKSGFSRALMIGGAVLAAAAAPLTAGVSAGVIGSLAPAIVGASGGLLTATGQSGFFD